MTLNKRTAEAAAKWWGDRLRKGDRAAFEASLIQYIESKLEERGKVFLNCDYDPQEGLLEAVRAAGLECRGFLYSAEGILPMKHSTNIKPGLIEPKEGYGNWTDPIFVT